MNKVCSVEGCGSIGSVCEHYIDILKQSYKTEEFVYMTYNDNILKVLDDMNVDYKFSGNYVYFRDV